MSAFPNGISSKSGEFHRAQTEGPLIIAKRIAHATRRRVVYCQPLIWPTMRDEDIKNCQNMRGFQEVAEKNRSNNSAIQDPHYSRWMLATRSCLGTKEGRRAEGTAPKWCGWIVARDGKCLIHHLCRPAFE
jgi:hypothetical protein